MVSRAYLGAWANGRGQVKVFDKENPEVSGVRSVGDATVVRYAYRTELTTLDLEAEYARIESRAIPALRNLASGGSTNREGEAAIIAFLDMHRERGGFADRTKELVPMASANILTGESRLVHAGIGDRIVLSRTIDQSRTWIRELPVGQWRWHILPVESGLITGDGAVLLWSERDFVCTVTFPISPTRLLIIGSGLDGTTVPINALVMNQSRRWLIGSP
ncbi:DUF4238 domain-containing protein [Microbacterium sp.]|uniref:DUF4238 domain-containing protein n=1 Tax=Microbacterium sp. TaxID=51671 RepID=UPI00257B417D|nr:DUF4238 domain-containing protein [Microbacterium sp.]|tara:strand:- start:10814 stop:11470 length:657 start_codon:yes stop_codon:yes gene_type:complete